MEARPQQSIASMTLRRMLITKLTAVIRVQIYLQTMPEMSTIVYTTVETRIKYEELKQFHSKI